MHKLSGFRMDLRKEAEARAQEQERLEDRRELGRKSFRKSVNRKKVPSDRDALATPDHPNETPTVAHLKEIDYKLNGARARAGSGEFIVPRWVPDEEVNYCHLCNSEFDWVNRKHHCRSCGNVCCESCTIHRSLLPHEYGYRDPCRVCDVCHSALAPYQRYLSTNIANHQRMNTIDVASTNCNVRRYFNLPFSSTLGSEIRKAAYSTHNLFSLEWIRDKAIPLRLLSEAKGLAFLTVVKGGFIFAPRIGTGLVVSRLPESKGGGWSAPTAISTVGLSWGAVIGLDMTDYVIILNSVEAVHAFSGSGQITIGAGIEVAVGPVGRSGSADIHISDTGLAPAYSYSHSRGLFAGLSLDGALILARHEINHRFYGRPITPAELLYGSVAPPRAAGPLYDALADALSSLPDVHHLRPYATTDSETELSGSISINNNNSNSYNNSNSSAHIQNSIDHDAVSGSNRRGQSIDYSKLYRSNSSSQQPSVWTESAKFDSAEKSGTSSSSTGSTRINIYGDDASGAEFSSFLGQQQQQQQQQQHTHTEQQQQQQQYKPGHRDAVSTNPFQNAVDVELESATTTTNVAFNDTDYNATV